MTAKETTMTAPTAIKPRCLTANQKREVALVLVLLGSVLLVGMSAGMAIMLALYAAFYLLRFFEWRLRRGARNAGEFLASDLRLAFLIAQLTTFVAAGVVGLFNFVPPLIAALS
jgi:hypothetical protein